MRTHVLTLPGIGDSGPQHWQSIWERDDASIRRVRQRDWDRPVCGDWVDALDRAVVEADADVVLVAHSLACLMLAHWVQQTARSVRGALLVAPPDPSGPNFPRDSALGFAPVPMDAFGFASIVVVSQDDPYDSLDFARRCAGAWGSRLVDIGSAGHINADSGLGSWPRGRALLAELAQ